MSATPTAELAGFIANLSYQDVPAPVRERVKDYILDALASALAGRQGDEVRQVQALASRLPPSAAARAWICRTSSPSRPASALARASRM